ncbi:MAG: GNAT family N-acetyltransferase [Alphaproteobacteria bacterium]|nr:GNAT family N-acetyltransferase [Alphaproteobacteria bacterium]
MLDWAVSVRYDIAERAWGAKMTEAVREDYLSPELEKACARAGVGLRPETDADLPFLRKCYALSRDWEMARAPMSLEEQKAFLIQQFEWQRKHYRAHYPDADWLIIERDGLPIGRVYTHRQAHDIRIMDIAILPSMRGNKIAFHLLAGYRDWGKRVKARVSLNVEFANPARRFYDRLGFKYGHTESHHHYLEVVPPGAKSGAQPLVHGTQAANEPLWPPAPVDDDRYGAFE